MFNIRLAGELAGENLYGKWLCHLPVAGDVFDGVLFCAVRFPTRSLG